MRLRDLEEKDAKYMLEWMHDDSVTNGLRTDFSKFTIEDCKKFIRCSKDKSYNAHYAIVSDEDEYMGTVSLKKINMEALCAEFAITIRKFAMGRGYSWYGMMEIIRIGFEEYGLETIYWCVSKTNTRAVRFYDKHHFHEVVDIPSPILDEYKEIGDLKWYSVLAGDDYKEIAQSRKSIAGCKVIRIKTIPTVNAGELSFFESAHDIPFEIKRLYYISKVPEGVRRGFHAHKELKQLLFCPYGKIQLILDDGKVREEIILSDPSVGIIIDHPVWREMLWLQKDSVLCVAASEYFDEKDYIRKYERFKEYQNSLVKKEM